MRNRFLNRIHAKNKIMKTTDADVKEENDFKEGCVLKLEKGKHEGNLDDFLVMMFANDYCIFC